MVSTTPAPITYLVAIDGTPCAAHALEVGAKLVSSLGGAAELHVLYVLDVSPAAASAMGIGPPVAPADQLESGRLVLDKACAEAARAFSGKVVGHLAAGPPWREIVQMASSLRADLLVVGTAGRTGLARMALGSVAEKVVRHAGCPVLVARPKDYHTHAEPSIEPPCVDCVAVQEKTARAELWCARHTAHHPRGHLHYELPPTFALGSMNFRP